MSSTNFGIVQKVSQRQLVINSPVYNHGNIRVQINFCILGFLDFFFVLLVE